MINLDLRELTEQNRAYFWQGAQMALNKMIRLKDESNEENIFLLTILLDMHKRIKRGENPESLNHLIRPEPITGEKKGPGWE